MRLDDVIHHARIVGPMFLNAMVVCWEEIFSFNENENVANDVPMAEQ